MSLVVATLELDTALQPIAHLNTESKCTWFHIHDDLPQLATMPPPEEFRQLLPR